jgi:hypothetical protein
MKYIITIAILLMTSVVFSQNKLYTSLPSMTVADLRELQIIIIEEQAKDKIYPRPKEDEDLLKRMQESIDKNPRVNATFAFGGIPQKYAELLLEKQLSQLNQFFEQRPKYQKAKRWAKIIFPQDTTVFRRNSAKWRVKLSDLETMKTEQ